MIAAEGSLGWEANFKLSWDILENSITDTRGIRSNIRTDEHGNKFLTGFTLDIPPSPAEQALIIAVGKGNRVADWLSNIHNLPVEAYLRNITEIRPPGEPRSGIATLTTSGNIHRSVDLNFADLERLLTNNDVKALRQLAHYSAGLRYSSDPINQFREFYLVLEDHYGKNHPYLQKYKYVRHALNHVELDFPSFAAQLLADIGVNYIDPSSPEAKKLVEGKLQSLKLDAFQVVSSLF